MTFHTKSRKLVATTAMALLLGLGMTACSGGGDGSSTSTPPSSPASPPPPPPPASPPPSTSLALPVQINGEDVPEGGAMAGEGTDVTFLVDISSMAIASVRVEQTDGPEIDIAGPSISVSGSGDLTVTTVDVDGERVSSGVFGEYTYTLPLPFVEADTAVEYTLTIADGTNTEAQTVSVLIEDTEIPPESDSYKEVSEVVDIRGPVLAITEVLNQDSPVVRRLAGITTSVSSFVEFFDLALTNPGEFGELETQLPASGGVGDSELPLPIIAVNIDGETVTRQEEIVFGASALASIFAGPLASQSPVEDLIGTDASNVCKIGKGLTIEIDSEEQTSLFIGTTNGLLYTDIGHIAGSSGTGFSGGANLETSGNFCSLVAGERTDRAPEPDQSLYMVMDPDTFAISIRAGVGSDPYTEVATGDVAPEIPNGYELTAFDGRFVDNQAQMFAVFTQVSDPTDHQLIYGTWDGVDNGTITLSDPVALTREGVSDTALVETADGLDIILVDPASPFATLIRDVEGEGAVEAILTRGGFDSVTGLGSTPPTLAFAGSERDSLEARVQTTTAE